MTTRGDTLKVGLVGCGEVTQFKHLVVLRDAPGLEVVALADLDEGRLRAVADPFRVSHRYRDAEALLKHPGLDVVAVCVPVRAHTTVALAALAAGKHVLIEKPLCLSLDEADSLRDAAAKSPGKVMIGHHMRWHRLIRKARVFIQRGGLGEVESIRTLWNSPRIGRDNPPWRFRREDGGGVLVEIAVHCFDLWRLLLGSEVEEIYATTSNGTRDDETLAVTARMKNGMLASGLCSERTPHEIEVEISGTAGRLRMGCQRFEGFEFHPAGSAPGQIGPRWNVLKNFLAELPGGAAGMRKGGDYFGSYRAEWLHFKDVIRNGAGVECTLEDGRRSLEVVLAAARSASSGQPVKLADAPRIITPAMRR
ncbi:MAG: Gfo/Idh/MocA family oxidoreductase [Verrucomicrobia bacterium]|nr:Gfo/Idh/MocA family oxidoreductase [Verrucomicrobiota bacterium]